jgi:hypothetical protein
MQQHHHQQRPPHRRVATRRAAAAERHGRQRRRGRATALLQHPGPDCTRPTAFCHQTRGPKTLAMPCRCAMSCVERCVLVGTEQSPACTESRSSDLCRLSPALTPCRPTEVAVTGGQKDWIQGPESRRERDRLGLRRRLLRPMSNKRERRGSEGRDGGKRGTRHAGAASRGTRNATAENTRREIKTEPLGDGSG